MIGQFPWHSSITIGRLEAMPGIRDFILTQAAPLPAGPIKAGIARAMTVYDKFDTDRAKIDNDPNLSDTGRRAKMREFLTADLHEVVRVRKLAEKAKANLSERRKNLQ